MKDHLTCLDDVKVVLARQQYQSYQHIVPDYEAYCLMFFVMSHCCHVMHPPYLPGNKNISPSPTLISRNSPSSTTLSVMLPLI